MIQVSAAATCASYRGIVASPFSLVTNATATFTLPTTGTITDGLGNVRPATITAEVDLFLRAQPEQQPVDMPGIEATTTILTGYAVDPMALDNKITRGTDCTLTWQGQQWTASVEGVNETYGVEGFIAETLTAKRGDDIRLRLLRQS